MSESIKILYISYNGMLESLGESQVLNYLIKLSKNQDFYLLSLEKQKDLDQKEAFGRIQKICSDNHIVWKPIVYGQSKLGKILNFIKLFYFSFYFIIKYNIKNLHTRSYFPTIIALVAKKILGIRYLFDTRGFQFDERADAEGLDRNNITFKLLKKIEKKLYINASAINMLSLNGKQIILNNELFSDGDTLQNIAVIPTCVDLEKFEFHEKNIHKPINIGYVGTVTGWYDFDKTLLTLKEMMSQTDVKFYIFNKGQHEFIRQKLIQYAIDTNKVVIQSVPFAEMPKYLKEIDVALFYIHPYFSKKASAATKLGEFFASGIPVLTNDGVGDHTYYVENYKTGKILDATKIENYNFIDIFNDLIKPNTSKKCKFVAEKYFSLEIGAMNYEMIYQKIFTK